MDISSTDNDRTQPAALRPKVERITQLEKCRGDSNPLVREGFPDGDGRDNQSGFQESLQDPGVSSDVHYGRELLQATPTEPKWS